MTSVEFKIGDWVKVGGSAVPRKVRAVGEDYLLVDNGRREGATVESVPVSSVVMVGSNPNEMTFEECLTSCVRMASKFSMQVELQLEREGEYSACARHWSIRVRPEFETEGPDLDTAVTLLHAKLLEATVQDEGSQK